jgi:hypothetical protein
MRLIKIIVEFISLLLVFLFVYAAANKLMDVQKFKVQLGLSPLLTAYASWLAWIVPLSEVCISVMLMIARTRLIALYMSFSLMVVFTSYIVAILKFSDFVPCSCGGILESLNWTEHLVFNCVFVLIAMVGVYLEATLHISGEVPKLKTDVL